MTMCESLEKLPMKGKCLKCGGVGLVSVVYASVGFDLWLDCATCGEISADDFEKDKSSDFDTFADQILEGEGLADDSTPDG